MIQPTPSVAVKIQGQLNCNGYMYDYLFFGEFDTMVDGLDHSPNILSSLCIMYYFFILWNNYMYE